MGASGHGAEHRRVVAGDTRARSSSSTAAGGAFAAVRAASGRSLGPQPRSSSAASGDTSPAAPLPPGPRATARAPAPAPAWEAPPPAPHPTARATATPPPAPLPGSPAARTRRSSTAPGTAPPCGHGRAMDPDQWGQPAGSTPQQRPSTAAPAGGPPAGVWSSPARSAGAERGGSSGGVACGQAHSRQSQGSERKQQKQKHRTKVAEKEEERQGAVQHGSGTAGQQQQQQQQQQELPLEQQVERYAVAAGEEGGDPLRCAMAVHLMNGCFLRAPSYDRAVALAAAAARASPRLAAALAARVAEGEPLALLAINALTYLALAEQVVPQLLSCGLHHVLLGQLRAAGSSPLEQQLLAGGLGLLLALVRGSGTARRALAGCRGMAGALAGVLGRHEGEGGGVVRQLALELLHEMVLTRKGLDQALCCAPLASALHRLRDTEAPGSRLQALARSALTDMAALARVMAPGT